jgi:hypothetical protein
MQTRINSDEISASYQTLGNIYTTEITSEDEEMMQHTSTSYVSDVNVVDAVRFLEYYLDEQLIAPGDESAGIVEMSVIYYHRDSRLNAGTLLGVLTFGFGFLFGLPTSTTVVDVETKAAFFDPDDHLITVQRGMGRGKKLDTMYNSSSPRKAHQRALKKAIEDLNVRIKNDPNLNKLPI